MGQAFRWTKKESGWVGVIGNVIFILSQTDDQIIVDSRPKLENPEKVLIQYFGMDTN